jgi:hypothetical protein
VLLKPLPYPDSSRLVSITGGATPTRFEEMKANAQSFSGIGAFTIEETRRALGAQQGDILRLVIGQSLRLTLLGVVTGVAGAIGLARLMQSLLFHISATDPVTFIAVVLLFLSVALVASYVPARRAARIDPMAALRI